MTRDDWCFQSMAGQLTCVCRTPFGSLDGIRARLAEVQAVASALTSSRARQYGQRLPALPGGITFDPGNPGAFKDALKGMSRGQVVRDGRAVPAATARPQPLTRAT
jgi:hypothetical protein